MKNTLLLIAVLATISLSVKSQETLEFPRNSDNRIDFSEVITVDSTITKTQLYLSAKAWAVNMFKDSKEVIELDDKEAGIIMGKGAFKVYPGMFLTNGFIKFTFKIQCKQGRYKYSVYDFIHISTKGDGYSGGALELETPACGRFSLALRGWDDLRIKTYYDTKDMLKDLEKNMKVFKKNVSGDDW